MKTAFEQVHLFLQDTKSFWSAGLLSYNGLRVDNSIAAVLLKDWALNNDHKVHGATDYVAALKYSQLLNWSGELDKLRSRLRSDPNVILHRSLVTRAVKAMTGLSEGDSFDRYCGFLSNFVYSIMTKLHRGVEFCQAAGTDAMLVLYGKDQGTGKSTAARFLVSPLSDYVWHTDFARLSDQFSARNLTRFFVAVLDELASADKADMERFKQTITSSLVSFRAMHSDAENIEPKVATMLGTSNTSVFQLFYDPTGMRRFHEIPTTSRKDGCLDLKALEDIDWISLYTSVPLESTSSMNLFTSYADYLKFLDEVREPSPIDLFLSESGMTPAYSGHRMPVEELYKKYREHFLESGNKPKYLKTKVKFSKYLEEVGFKKIRIRDDGKDIQGFFINISSEGRENNN